MGSQGSQSPGNPGIPGQPHYHPGPQANLGCPLDACVLWLPSARHSLGQAPFFHREVTCGGLAVYPHPPIPSIEPPTTTDLTALHDLHPPNPSSHCVLWVTWFMRTPASGPRLLPGAMLLSLHFSGEFLGLALDVTPGGVSPPSLQPQPKLPLEPRAPSTGQPGNPEARTGWVTFPSHTA